MADINYEITVSPEVVLSATVIDEDVAVTVDDANSLAVTVTEPDVISENAEAEEILTVVINTGEKGDDGDPGPAGPQGDGLQVDASGNAAGRSAYDNEAEGFTYLDTENALLYLRDSPTPGDWSTGVAFGGPDGADGNTILSGIVDPVIGDGVDGDFFLNTVTYDFFGPKATTWPAGVSIKGTPGDPGTDGNTILYDTQDPTTEGNDGDFFINTATDFIFGPKATTWPAGTDLKGADGVDGNTILYGVVNPTTEGNDGDFYINTTTDFIFGPKGESVPGTWPPGTTLGGADGEDGNTILYGTDDPTTEGKDGDFYINTATSFIFGPKGVPTPGVWPAGTTLGGADGNTILYGNVDPTTEGNDGDYYINNATDFIFGPKGVPTPGVWPTGTTLGGADGNTILYGPDDPVAEGKDGDFYINTTTDYIFGPKALGSWPAGTDLRGEDGLPGPVGPAGTSYTGPEIYVQASQPSDVPDGTIWISTV